MEKVRYLNKRYNANERENYSRWWHEQIQHYGTSTTYYVNNYSTTNHNFLYGEDSVDGYTKAEDVILLTDITNDQIMLSKFGIMADADMTAVIHISAFYEKFGPHTEPKAGDLIQLTEFGADRPGHRMAPIYEITERDDEFLPMTNPLIGHYVWYIKCKRFEYSYEPGVPDNNENKQSSDGGGYGLIVPTATFAPTQTFYPTQTPYPTPTFYPTQTPRPTKTSVPTSTPYPTPEPTHTPNATPEDTSVPTSTPHATSTPYPTPYPTQTLYATETPYPTQTSYPTQTPYPTQTFYPTQTPYPTQTLAQPYEQNVNDAAGCIYDYYDQRNAGLDRNLVYYVPPASMPDIEF